MCWPDNWAISQNLVFICFLKNICTFDVHLVTVFWLTATVYTKQIALCSSDRRSLNMSEISTRRSHRDSLLRPQLRHCSLIQVSDDTHWLKAASICCMSNFSFLICNGSEWMLANLILGLTGLDPSADLCPLTASCLDWDSPVVVAVLLQWFQGLSTGRYHCL